MRDRFKQFMRGDVETRGGQVVHAIVFVLMYIGLYGVFVRLPVFILGWDEGAPAALDRFGIFVMAFFGTVSSTTETSRRMFWRVHRRRPTRGEGAIMGFTRGVAYWILVLAAMWVSAYEAPWFWTFIVTIGIMFIVVGTAAEAYLMGWKWDRIEDQNRKRQNSSLPTAH